MTDAEIRAILPQAQRITRGHGFQDADCSYNVYFPGYTSEGVELANIVRASTDKRGAVRYLTTARKREQGLRGPRRNDAARLGADECYDSEIIMLGAPSQITCRKGGVVFSADAGGFLFVKGSSHDPAQKERAWYDRVVLEIVKTLTAKLPPAG